MIRLPCQCLPHLALTDLLPCRAMASCLPRPGNGELPFTSGNGELSSTPNDGEPNEFFSVEGVTATVPDGALLLLGDLGGSGDRGGAACRCQGRQSATHRPRAAKVRRGHLGSQGAAHRPGQPQALPRSHRRRSGHRGQRGEEGRSVLPALKGSELREALPGKPLVLLMDDGTFCLRRRTWRPGRRRGDGGTGRLHTPCGQHNSPRGVWRHRRGRLRAGGGFPCCQIQARCPSRGATATCRYATCGSRQADIRATTKSVPGISGWFTQACGSATPDRGVLGASGLPHLLRYLVEQHDQYGYVLPKRGRASLIYEPEGFCIERISSTSESLGMPSRERSTPMRTGSSCSTSIFLGTFLKNLAIAPWDS